MTKEKKYLIIMSVIVAILVVAAMIMINPTVRYNEDGSYAHFEMSDNYVSVLKHPAFKNAAGERTGRFLIPYTTDLNKAFSAFTTIENSPWIDNTDLLDALNALIDQKNAGIEIFYDFYTDEEKAADSTKADTGIFFLKGEPGMPFVILNGGGGYADVAVLGEALASGVEFVEAGYNVFAIKYRAEMNLSRELGRSSYEIAADDVARAMEFILDHAEEFEIDTSNYAIGGYSAGAALTEGWGVKEIGYEKYGLPKPTCVMLIYGAGLSIGGGVGELTADYPPTFTIVGDQDNIAFASMPAFKEKAESLGIELFYKIYPDVGHGFGRASGTSAEGWIQEAIAFWESVS